MPILRLRNLSVRFDTGDGCVDAVRSLNLEISESECLGIVGESGSGKSQAFLACMGLLAANGQATGSVQFDGKEILNVPEKRINSIRGKEVGMIFQDPLASLTPHLRIGEQMGEMLRTHTGIAGAESKKICLEWLDRVRIPEAADRYNFFPHQLSGGMRQRVIIAIAMICRPRLLIADEPTTALDVSVQAGILDLMAEIGGSEGTAIALITHDMGVVAQMCERIAVMRKGEIIEQGLPEEIFLSPKREYTCSLLDAVPRFDKPKEPASRRASTANPVLSVHEIKVHFPVRRTNSLLGRKTKLKAVDGICFSVQQGETLGIVGESGSGKSTLARSVLQLVHPSAGSVSWLGKEIAGLNRGKMKPFRKDLQIVFQDPYASLDPRMTLGATIGEPMKVFKPGTNARERRRAVLA
ncbi:MAG: ATP-binding cassette domain-containing protein, partial [Albidovulum sp.]|nr:ATP-binding cassette domain-containing protein [Albidovulum sp.]